jgi:hypothetical protein
MDAARMVSRAMMIARAIVLLPLNLIAARKACQQSPFPLPAGLVRLIRNGVWPSMIGPSMNHQQLRPIIPTERVRLFAADESLICLQPPPFPTIEEERVRGGSGDFWEACGALDQIDPKRAVIIGDFGLGSDSPIILDFARDATNPPVLWLRWGLRGQGNKWVQGAHDFDEFVALLGLTFKLYHYPKSGKAV